MNIRRGGTFLAFVLFVTLSTMLAACGGGGGGGSTGGTTGGTASTTAVQTSSAGAQSTTAATGTTTTFQNLSKISVAGAGLAPKFASLPSGNVPLDKVNGLTGKMGNSKVLLKAVEKARMALKAGPKAATKAPASAACTDGGTYTGAISGSSFDITFDNCKEGGVLYDGKITLTITAGSGSSYTITMTFAPKAGSSATTFNSTEFSGDYSVAVLKLAMNITLTNVVTVGASTIDYGMTATGTMDMTDYIESNTYTITFTSFSTDMSFDLAATTTFTTTTTIGGSFSETWTEGTTAHSMSATYTSFVVTIVEDTNATSTFPAGFTTIAPSGTVAITYTPSSSCSVSSVTVATTTPIKFDNATGNTVAGVITLNTTTTVTFNADGTVTVNDGTNSTTYNSMFEMNAQCPFAVPSAEGSAPPIDTSGTGNTGITADTMTVTSLSTAATGGVLTCYTDLHVNYYAETAPTATTVGTWMVDWHTGLVGLPTAGGSCTSPTSYPDFQEARDIDSTPDGICDVGLDINGSATDDTSGGLEHFTALKLPVGYYVISMNNYSCDELYVTNDVTIQIGNKAFGPYTATYTAHDFEAMDANSWFRVRDVRVNADGTVDVIAPDTTLEAWHDGAFGLAPKNKPLTRAFLK